MLTTVGIGGIEVVSLLDEVENMDNPDILDPFHGPSDEVWDPYRTLFRRCSPRTEAGERVHGTILRSHGRTFLVDTGVGGPTSPAMSRWYPAPGKLLGSLAESGTAPGDVDVVVMTHVHDDHIGGTVTAQGEPAFPNARYVVNRIDLEWLEAFAQETDEGSRGLGPSITSGTGSWQASTGLGSLVGRVLGA